MYGKHLWALLTAVVMMLAGCNTASPEPEEAGQDALTGTSWVLQYIQESCGLVERRFDETSGSYYNDDCFYTATLSFHSGGVYSLTETHAAVSSSDVNEFIIAYGDYVYNAPAGTLKEGPNGMTMDISFSINGDILYLVSPYTGNPAEYQRVR